MAFEIPVQDISSFAAESVFVLRAPFSADVGGGGTGNSWSQCGSPIDVYYGE